MSQGKTKRQIGKNRHARMAGRNEKNNETEEKESYTETQFSDRVTRQGNLRRCPEICERLRQWGIPRHGHLLKMTERREVNQSQRGRQQVIIHDAKCIVN